jgi:hypothetical protein
LNAGGATWNEPVTVDADDADCVSVDSADPKRELRMQVTRASDDEPMWAKLGRDRAVNTTFDAASAADELMRAVTKKSKRYGDSQRKNLTLVLDAARTPGHTFRQVFDSFVSRHAAACRACGFAAVWLIGAVDELTLQLDR